MVWLAQVLLLPALDELVSEFLKDDSLARLDLGHRFARRWFAIQLAVQRVEDLAEPSG